MEEFKLLIDNTMHMKKIILTIIAVFLAVATYGQKTVRMEKDGGIYKISCKVNGAPMKMYFDTGASTVSISKATALYLLDNDLISPKDFRGKTKTSTADGSISDNMVINLRDIEIAGMHLRNVLATVSYSLNAPLLLGQTAIQRLGKISLQGNILTIHTRPSAPNQKVEQRAKLDKKLRYLRDTRDSNPDCNYEILEVIEKIEEHNSLTEFELFCKTMALGNIEKFDETVVSAQTWIDRYSTETDSIDWKMRVYYVAADANIRGENGDKEKGMEYLQRCSYYFESSNSSGHRFYWGNLPLIMSAYDEYKGNGFFNSIYAAKEAIKYFLKQDKITLTDINYNRCKNWDKSFLLYCLGWLLDKQNTWKVKQNSNYQPGEYEINLLKAVVILAAKAGDEESIQLLRSRNLNYDQILSSSELNLVGLQ